MTPIQLQLPAGWHPVPPERVDLDVAFLAIKLDTHRSGFTATIAIDGDEQGPGESLADLADRSAANLQGGIVIKRTRHTGHRLSQTLRLTKMIDGTLRRVERVEEYLTLPGSGVLRVISTATTDQADTVSTDLEKLVAQLEASAAVRPA